MKSLLKRVVLAVLFIFNLCTLLLNWQVIEGLTFRKGTIVLTGNLILSAIIIGLYFISLIFYNKSPNIFFITGICSLSMLAALEFSKFEAYGRFNNPALGVYLGLVSIVITIIAYAILLKRKVLNSN